MADNLKATLDSMCTQLGALRHTADTSIVQQQRISFSVEGLQRSIDTGQATTHEHLDSIESSLSQMRLREDHVRSQTAIRAPTEAILARVFRAELQRVVMPTVRQCFDKYKANADGKLDGVKESIDEMARQLDRGLHGDTPFHTRDPTESPLTTFDSAALRERGAIATATATVENSTTSTIPDDEYISTRRRQHWRRSWKFKWAIGRLWVTITSSRVQTRIPRQFYVGIVPSAQKVYRVAIYFQPAQSLITFRGLTLSVDGTQDQRGHYQLCPAISTFAIVSSDADVFAFARDDNVEGLINLFDKRLAAPSDRSEDGETPLMVCHAPQKFCGYRAHPLSVRCNVWCGRCLSPSLGRRF